MLIIYFANEKLISC